MAEKRLTKQIVLVNLILSLAATVTLGTTMGIKGGISRNNGELIQQIGELL